MKSAWNEFYSDEDIKKIQKIELNSLDVFADICKKLDINFYLYGGSLLGAIKYEGFVPWDDDLDIALLRKDYEKLLTEGEKIIPDRYELQHVSLNRRTPYHYIKFRRTDTELVEYRNHKLKINHGVYFDIYPIDNIPDEYVDLLKQKIEYDRWVNILQIRQNFRNDCREKNFKNTVKLFIRLIQSCVAHVFSAKYLINKIDKISSMYNRCETHHQGNLSFPKPKNYFNGILPEKEINFENRNMLIPSGYKLNLMNRYGDYSRLPPESKRVGHKPYSLKLEMRDNI